MRFILIIILISLSFFNFASSANTIEEWERLLSKGDAKSVIKDIENVSDKTIEHYQLLVSAYLTQDLDDAEAVAEMAINNFPNNYQVYLTHASVMGAQASDSIFNALSYAEKALNSLNKAVELEPENVTTLNALMSFYIAAPSIAGGDMEKAKLLVNRIMEIDPIEGQFSQARLYRSDDKIEEAEKVLLALATKDESQFKAQYELGNLYSSQKDYDKAIEFLIAASHSEIPKPTDTATKEEIKNYESLKWQQAYATYAIGRTAIDSKSHNNEGIDGLTRFLNILESASFSISNLPSENWAMLRLTELQINSSNYEAARITFNKLTIENDKNFKSIHKKLARKLKG